MATFTAWTFDSPEGAAHAADTLEQAEREQLVKVLDHAIVSWPVGEANPHASHGHDDTMHGAAWGSLWGVLFGALFVVTDEGDLDRLGERFRGVHMTLLSSNLTDTERDELMETFG